MIVEKITMAAITATIITAAITVTAEQITMIVAAIAAIGTYFANKNAALAAARGAENSRKVEEVHVAINSKMTELIRTSVAEALAEGKVQGIQQQKAEESGGRIITDRTAPFHPPPPALPVEVVNTPLTVKEHDKP